MSGPDMPPGTTAMLEHYDGKGQGRMQSVLTAPAPRSALAIQIRMDAPLASAGRRSRIGMHMQMGIKLAPAAAR